jgi:soluble lytic murein transglycosylase-like protein
MHLKVRKSSVILRVFALVLGCLLAAVTAGAQEKGSVVAPATQGGTGSSVVSESQKSATAQSAKAAGEGVRVPSEISASVPPAKSANDNTPATVDVLDDYKKSLGDLQALYEKQVLKLETQNSQMKALFKDGIISRVEMEKSDQELVDARAKVEEARNQIVEANKPVPVVAPASNSVLSNTSWSTGNSRVDSLVRFYGNKYGVDPYLIFCLMHQESRFSNNATSYKGAQGLMQLMPGTASRYGVTNPYDVSQSIMGGTRYLKDLLQMFNGRVDLALAGYNAGEGAVIKHGYTIPPYAETRNYVRLITARYAMKPAS